MKIRNNIVKVLPAKFGHRISSKDVVRTWPTVKLRLSPRHIYICTLVCVSAALLSIVSRSLHSLYDQAPACTTLSAHSRELLLAYCQRHFMLQSVTFCNILRRRQIISVFKCLGERSTSKHICILRASNSAPRSRSLLVLTHLTHHWQINSDGSYMS